MRIHFTRTDTYEFTLDVDLPEDTQMDLDAGLGLEGLSEEGSKALFDVLADATSAGTAEGVRTDTTMVITPRGTDSPMLGNLTL